MIQRMIAVIALTVAPAVFAQTYIVPEGDCGAQTLHVQGNAISANQVAWAYVYQPKKRIDVNPVAGAAHSLDFKAAVDEGDVVMAGVEFKPMAVGDETRTAHAKALLFCGPQAPTADWMRASDLGLDIVPQEWNPLRAHMKAGDRMRFIVVDKSTGKYELLKDQPMELHRSSGELVAVGTPASGGGMNFPFPEPGTYFVLATYRRPDPAAAGHSLVDTSTLAFVVK